MLQSACTQAKHQLYLISGSVNNIQEFVTYHQRHKKMMKINFLLIRRIKMTDISDFQFNLILIIQVSGGLENQLYLFVLVFFVTLASQFWTVGNLYYIFVF